MSAQYRCNTRGCFLKVLKGHESKKRKKEKGRKEKKKEKEKRIKIELMYEAEESFNEILLGEIG